MTVRSWEEVMYEDEWHLDDAIRFIKETDFSAVDYPDTFQSDFINSRTAKRFIKHFYPDEYVFIYELADTEISQKKGYYNEIMVKPREFLSWCDSEGIPFKGIALERFLDYTFWAHKSDWSFDEAFLVLFSETCPFPYEINDVFENDLWFDKATEFHKKVAKLDFTHGFIEANKYDFIECAIKLELKVPKPIIAVYNRKILEIKKRREEANYIDWSKWFGMPTWTVLEGMCLATGTPPKHLDEVDEYSLFNNTSEFTELYDLFNRSYICGDITFIKKPERQDLYDGIIKRDIMLGWLLSTGKSIPEEMKILIGEVERNCNEAKGYSTPYIDLMYSAIEKFNISNDNQEKHDVLVEWFKLQIVDGTKVSENEAKKLASFVRLPSSKKGGNKKL